MNVVQSTPCIEHLAEHQDIIPILATWDQQQWGHLLPGKTFEDYIFEYKERTTLHTIPETFVALNTDGVPIGMISLVEHDMLTRWELSPWLASLYIVPEFRQRAVAVYLTLTIMTEAITLGLNKLYAFTTTRKSKVFGTAIKGLGWKPIEQTRYRGEEVVIYMYEVPSQTAA